MKIIEKIKTYSSKEMAAFIRDNTEDDINVKYCNNMCSERESCNAKGSNCPYTPEEIVEKYLESDYEG